MEGRPRCTLDPLQTPVATSRSSKSSLRLYPEQPPKPVRSPIDSIASLPEVLRAFQRATGWSLQHGVGAEPKSSSGPDYAVPATPAAEAVFEKFRLGAVEGSEARKPPVDWEAARGLASALADMVDEFAQVRTALRQREAELAAGVPLIPHANPQGHLAARLEAVLRSGAEAIGCHAAALYLLDEATSKLKLRSCWGLPLDRLTAPARPLQGAVADLEALLGHAVVLEDTRLIRHWNVPEDFPAAACVPVSTPTTILGTLWVFSSEKRDLNDHQTNILEVVAGRLAADLEREMLWNEAMAAVELRTQLAAAERLQRNQLPTIAPLLAGWDLAGWTAQAATLGGALHDWFCLPDGLFAVALGHAMHQGIEAALAASALKAALRAHGQYYREAQQTLKRLNLTLWTGSAGDQRATLFYGLIETTTGRVCCASAGRPGVLLIRPTGWESLSRTSSELGESPESDYEQFGYQLQPGECLVMFTEGGRTAADIDGRSVSEAGIVQILRSHLDRPAAELVDLVRRHIEGSGPACPSRDRSVLVVKRRWGA